MKGAVRRACAGVPLHLALVGLLAALAAGPAAAQPYDPRLGWKTLRTPHFRVHFHDGLERLARRVADAAERAHAALVPAFANDPPGGTEIVLSDDADDANGSATPIPYDTIRLFAVPPASFSELNDERDWVEGLVSHEYVHILHLDTVRGWPAAVNTVFGKLLTPSGYSPPLIVEGLAVLHEGEGEREIDGGRNANALFDMYERALTLGAFPRLDEVTGQPLQWPRGDLPYLLGGRFFRFIRARAGPGALTELSKDQGSRLWPYRFDDLAERHLGGSLGDLWRDFEAVVRARAEADLAAVRQRPVTSARPLTRRGSQVLHPRWLPDGSGLVFFDAGPDERPGLRRVTAAGDDLGRAATIDSNGTFALGSAREAVVAAADVHREFAVYDDLRLVDLETGAQRRLTFGERATDPDLRPGGMTLVYAVHLRGGEMALRRVRLDGGAPETLFQRPGVQVGMPRISPDGRRIAFELQENGRRDIALWEGGEVAFVTDDDALDVTPSWSPDGKTLYFSSERTGVYNVYAFEVGTETPSSSLTSTPSRRHVAGRLHQVTNVEMGAFEPQVSPDGTTLAFVGYSRRGYDLATIPVDRARWLEPAPPRARPLRGPEAAPTPEPPPLPARPYHALDTLRPTFWLPMMAVDGGGTTFGAITGGADVLLQHLYGVQAWYGVYSREVGYGATYIGTWLYPRLQLTSTRVIGTTPGTAFLEEQWMPLQASLSFTQTHLDRFQALTLGWRALHLRSLGGIPQITSPGVEPYRNGTGSELSLGLAYGDARRFVNAISPEEGRVLGLFFRYASPALGGSFSYASARASLSQYLRVPFTQHVVLGVRGSVGAASGTLGGRQPFSIGGPPPLNIVDVLLSSLLGPSIQSDVLRGYPSGAFAGSTVANVNLELRFPLATLERGYRAWPVQLRRLHGALFLDGGGAFAAISSDQGRSLGAVDRLRFGAGGELRAELVLGYYLRTDLRLGVARGLGRLLAPWQGGRPPADPLAETQLYVTLGPSF